MSKERIWGRQAIFEALRAGRRRVHSIEVDRGLGMDADVEEMCALARSRGGDVHFVERGHLDAQEPHENHQGIMGFFDPYPYASVSEMLAVARRSSEHPFIIAVANITDPHNLGSILRTAECAGVHGVIIPKRRAAQVTPAAVRVSSGASEYVRVARVSNLVRALEELKDERLWVYGAEADGHCVYEMDTRGGVVLCLGSEGEGLPRLVRDRCDELVALPLRGRVESLNVGVAAGVITYEIVRRRMAEEKTTP